MQLQLNILHADMPSPSAKNYEHEENKYQAKEKMMLAEEPMLEK